MTANIQNAYDLYLEGERTGDSDAYDRAAAIYDALDMSCSAARCREKAQHYRLITACHSQAEEEPA